MSIITSASMILDEYDEDFDEDGCGSEYRCIYRAADGSKVASIELYIAEHAYTSELIISADDMSLDYLVLAEAAADLYDGHSDDRIGNIVMLETIKVEPEYRGNGLLKEMLERLERLLPAYFECGEYNMILNAVPTDIRGTDKVYEDKKSPEYDAALEKLCSVYSNTGLERHDLDSGVFFDKFCMSETAN